MTGVQTCALPILKADIRYSVEESTPPDWESFEHDLPEILKDCDCISIVQIFAREHLGSFESEAKKIIRRHSHIPVILGHDLFPDLNVLRRGSGALLNAKLVPVIYDFLTSIREVFTDFGLDLPIVIVRSDGSLMSDDCSFTRPVETILTGPAASILGARKLSGEKNAIVVDMGGTTTDVAVIKDGYPLRDQNGIQIGSWKTFVRGMFVDTFGLGGDTCVHFSNEKGLYLEHGRVLPMCMLASRYPEVLPALLELSKSNYNNRKYFPLYEFLVLMHPLPEGGEWSDQERILTRRLENGLLMLADTIRDIGIDLYNLKTERLEREGIIRRAGFTPTDAMHIRGDFRSFSTDASKYAADYICHELTEGGHEWTMDELCESIDGLVRKRLYCSLVRILLGIRCPEQTKKLTYKQLRELIHLAYNDAEERLSEEKCGHKPDGALFLTPLFHTDAVLIGEGAPTHIFLDDVAKMLGTHAVIPKNAEVANAIGAIAGKITVSDTAVLRPSDVSSPEEGFVAICKNKRGEFSDYNEAAGFAKAAAKESAENKAMEYGAKGKTSCEFSSRKNEVRLKEQTVFVEEIITANVTGSAFE